MLYVNNCPLSKREKKQSENKAIGPNDSSTEPCFWNLFYMFYNDLCSWCNHSESTLCLATFHSADETTKCVTSPAVQVPLVTFLIFPKFSGIIFLGFFPFSQAVTGKTDWQGRKYDGIVLYSNVGNEGHCVQGRENEGKGVGKWKLIKSERSLHIPNYAMFSGWFLWHFDILITALTLLLFAKFPKVG